MNPYEKHVAALREEEDSMRTRSRRYAESVWNGFEPYGLGQQAIGLVTRPTAPYRAQEATVIDPESGHKITADEAAKRESIRASIGINATEHLVDPIAA